MKPAPIQCSHLEGIKLLDINNKSVCLKGSALLNVGQQVDFDITLPRNLGVLSLAGKVTKVVPMKEKAQKVFRYNIKIGSVDDVNRKILQAYVEYLERKKIIDNAFTKLKIYKQYLMILTKESPSRYLH